MSGRRGDAGRVAGVLRSVFRSGMGGAHQLEAYAVRACQIDGSEENQQQGWNRKRQLDEAGAIFGFANCVEAR